MKRKLEKSLYAFPLEVINWDRLGKKRKTFWPSAFYE
jgi:hypothetical protein